jgi:hypothetical protein
MIKDNHKPLTEMEKELTRELEDFKNEKERD